MTSLNDRKTPGVYVTEIAAVPPSAVGVETAIPAFVGYTGKAEIQGRSVEGQPIRITSLKEYDDVFGGPPHTIFTFEAATQDDFDVKYSEIGGSDANADTTSGKILYKKVKPSVQVGLLRNSLRLFYANGGGTCFVVSVGPYGTSVDSDQLVKGVKALENQVGPTMLVAPDLSLLAIPDPATPWVVPGFRDVVVAMLNQCRATQDRVALLDVVHARDIDRKSPLGALDKAIEQFRTDVDHDNRDYGIAYFPYLETSMVRATDVDFASFEQAGITDFILSEAQKLFPRPQDPAVQAAIKAIKGDLMENKDTRRAAVTEALKNTDDAAAQTLNFLYNSFFPTVAPATAPVAPAAPPVDSAPSSAPASPPAAPPPVDNRTRDNNLSNLFPALAQMYRIAAKKLNRLPASAAMAGVMTFTDSTRGVWNAPANIALVSVDGPSLSINDDVQGDLNTPLDGKAINIIREFIGRGPVVWGARTLDGNSNDYCYVQVRRTLIYIEQSVKAALKPFVLAANDGKTWVTVIATVSNFLQDLWAKGGLMGATPTEAFSVDCGLETTMTGRDVLEGCMIVQILVQLIHPGEFIELTFKQKMGNAG
ncbi:MAG: phage tail sheath C-terminal domain-containing protein [Acidobacteriota bacterium]